MPSVLGDPAGYAVHHHFARLLLADFVPDPLHLAFNGGISDPKNAVPFLKSRFVGGTAGNDLADDDFVVTFGHDDAKPCGSVSFLHGFGRRVMGVRSVLSADSTGEERQGGGENQCFHGV